MFIKVKRNATMYEIYGRVGRMIGIDPKFIKLNGKIPPNGTKIMSMDPKMKIIDELNRVAVVKVEFSDQMIYDVETIVRTDDNAQMKRFMISGQIYNLYKFPKVKYFKRIIIFNSKIIGQWPDLHDAGNGIPYDDSIELDKISAHLMLIWSLIMNKVFKIWLEGTLRTKIEEIRSCSIGELVKRLRKVYGMAKDCVLTDSDGKEYLNDVNAIQFKKDLWIARTRKNRNTKKGKFSDIKIIVDNGETNVYLDTRIFSIWGLEAMNLYLNNLTGLKNRDFLKSVNGIIWNDEMSIGSLKPQVIRVMPNQFNVISRIISVISLETLNIRLINLKFNG
jgi:hypothetical protein